VQSFTFIDALYVAGALIVSIGGATGIIALIGKLFGDFFSKRLLDHYNNKHTVELESIKTKYQKELESFRKQIKG
jgi:hypothetical protein